MHVEVAEAGPCRRTLKIRIPSDRVREHLKDAYQSASRQVDIPGFRRGKIPRAVIEKKYGEAIRSEAKESLLKRTFQEACQQHNLTVVGQPEVEGVDDSPLAESEGLEYQVHVEIQPEFELGDVTGIEIQAHGTKVTDEDVQGALQQLADQKKTLDVIDEPVAQGDFVRADLRFADADGNPVLERKGLQLNTNIPVAGTDQEEFAARLTGSDKGQELTLDLTFPDNFEKQELRGTKGSVVIQILEVLRVQAAPIDDELAKGFDFDGLEALREQLRKRIGDEKVRGENTRQEEAILEILASEHPFELPESMVADQAEHQLRLFAERLKHNRVPEEEIEKKVEEAREEAKRDAERRVRLFFILDKVARKEKIFVTESDVDVELRNIAAQNNVSLDEVIEYYDKNNMVSDLRLGIMERKVREFLRAKARISDNTA